MKRNKILLTSGCLCCIFAVIQLVVCVYSYRDFYRYHFAFDARLRQNEVRCSRTGVNPFDVWNRSVVHENFRGIDRPDKATEDAPAKLLVHSYPAWHTAYLWCVGWMSTPFYLGVYYVCFGIALAILCFILSSCAPDGTASRWFYFGMIAFPLLYRISACFVTGNYGLFIAIMMAGLISSVNAKRTISVGILWAAMMIKPQIAVLLFWPLLMHKQYVSMLIAFTICIAATCAVSCVYSCSPVELILQIPAIGAPYGPSAFIREFLIPLLGKHAAVIWSSLVFLLCGCLTWRLRFLSMWWTIVPALLLFPVWTYSQFHDGISAWPLYVLIPLSILSVGSTADLRSRRYTIFFGGGVIVSFMVETICSVLIGANICNQRQCGLALGISRTIFTIICLWHLDFIANRPKIFLNYFQRGSRLWTSVGFKNPKVKGKQNK